MMHGIPPMMPRLSVKCNEVCGNLTLVCDTPSNHALSFDEVSLNLFE